MTSTHNVHAHHRRLGRIVALSLALALAPVAILDGTASAQGAVTGLTQGSQGDAVRAVQQALVNQGIALAGGGIENWLTRDVRALAGVEIGFHRMVVRFCDALRIG